MDKRSQLIRMVRCEPCVRSCLQRISQSLMYNPIVIMENGQPLQKKLEKHINTNLETFLHGCVEMAHVCGFVAFYIKRENGIPTFKALPMGTFTWYTQLVHDKQSSEVIEYHVEYFGGNIKNDEILIYNYHTPCMLPPLVKGDVLSPLDNVFSYYQQKEIQLKTVVESEKWNMQKHLAITEKIDLKDPTTTGLALLDDMRLYNLTGQHTGMQTHRLLNHRTENQSSNATQGTFQWVKTVFQNTEGENQAQTHILPPNTEVHELAPIEYSQLYEYMSAQFENAVFMYFDLAPIAKDKTNSSTAEQQTSRFQHNKIQAMGRFCQKVIEFAYSQAFKVDLNMVECKIKPMPRLQLDSIDDIKTLTEAGIMNPQDKMRTRAMFMES